MAEKPPVPRIVHPRKTGYTHFPLMAVDLEGGQWVTEQGEVFSLDSLPSCLPGLEPAIVIVPDAPRLLAHLNSFYSENPLWQYRVTPLKRQVIKANGELSKWKIGSTLVNFFGWTRQHGRQRNRYHYPLDPNLFCRAPVEDFLPDGPNYLLRLMWWGVDVRDWCKSQDLKVSPTAGGLAAQLLKDPRWWPEKRRKVPRATNERIRPRLPGNYYRLYANEGQEYNATYLDQKSAHHTIATSLAFPHPDTLNARGFFDVPDVPGVTVPEGRPWLKAGTAAFQRMTTQAHGLLYAKVSVPHMRADAITLPWARTAGTRMAWIYTNELDLVRDLGIRIEHITGAWCSFDTDPGVNGYARFALGELEKATSERKRWMKATLLATYGIMAAKPSEQEFGFYRAEGGEERMYPAGSSMIPARAFKRGEREGVLVNVLYRGMIEAEQRRRSLLLARELRGAGMRILAIYADSVFVEQGPPLPLLPPEWRIESHLDALYFNSATHFTSRQLTKLPGVKRDTIERVQLMAQVRGHK